MIAITQAISRGAAFVAEHRGLEAGGVVAGGGERCEADGAGLGRRLSSWRFADGGGGNGRWEEQTGIMAIPSGSGSRCSGDAAQRGQGDGVVEATAAQFQDRITAAATELECRFAEPRNETGTDLRIGVRPAEWRVERRDEAGVEERGVGRRVVAGRRHPLDQFVHVVVQCGAVRVANADGLDVVEPRVALVAGFECGCGL